MANNKDEIEEPEEEKMEEVNDMRMSRTEEPEFEVNFDKFRDKFVYDGSGNKIRFGDIYKKQKTIIIFVRVSSLIVFSFASWFVLAGTKWGKNWDQNLGPKL